MFCHSHPPLTVATPFCRDFSPIVGSRRSADVEVVVMSVLVPVAMAVIAAVMFAIAAVAQNSRAGSPRR
jgi:hypothetical protein